MNKEQLDKKLISTFSYVFGMAYSITWAVHGLLSFVMAFLDPNKRYIIYINWFGEGTLEMAMVLAGLPFAIYFFHRALKLEGRSIKK